MLVNILSFTSFTLLTSAHNGLRGFVLFSDSLFVVLNDEDLVIVLLRPSFLVLLEAASLAFFCLGGTSSISCLTFATFELLKEIDFDRDPVANQIKIIYFSDSKDSIMINCKLLPRSE